MPGDPLANLFSALGAWLRGTPAAAAARRAASKANVQLLPSGAPAMPPPLSPPSPLPTLPLTQQTGARAVSKGPALLPATPQPPLPSMGAPLVLTQVLGPLGPVQEPAWATALTKGRAPRQGSVFTIDDNAPLSSPPPPDPAVVAVSPWQQSTPLAAGTTPAQPDWWGGLPRNVSGPVMVASPNDWRTPYGVGTIVRDTSGAPVGFDLHLAPDQTGAPPPPISYEKARSLGYVR